MTKNQGYHLHPRSPAPPIPCWGGPSSASSKASMGREITPGRLGKHWKNIGSLGKPSTCYISSNPLLEDRKVKFYESPFWIDSSILFWGVLYRRPEDLPKTYVSSTCFGPSEAGDGRAGKSAMAHGGSIAGLMAKWSEHNGDGLEV